MIDLHVHLLPGIDDGPADADESDRMVEAAVADGVTVLCATPHLRDDFPDVRVHEIRAHAREVRHRARGAAGVIPAAEVSVGWALAACDDDLRAASYGGLGRDLLVETPYGPLPGTFEALLFDLAARGYRITLAHPERNPTFRRDPPRLAALVRRGALVQITASSLAGSNPRSRSRRMARSLVKEGLAHVIASDAHAATGPRAPQLSRAVAVAESLAGARGRWMVTDAPAAILAGAPLPRPPASRRGRIGFGGAAQLSNRQT